MILGSIQPSYLAWIPFLERVKKSDVFIYLDDVEYSKNSFHNRNRIKTSNGPLTLTVPVLYSGNSKKFINSINIDYKQNWQAKHWKSIEYSYAKSPFFWEAGAMVKEILFKQYETLADLNIAFIESFRNYLGIKTPCYRSSEITVEGTANDKLINLCHHFGATKFIVKPGTEEYHPKEYFQNGGIDFEYFTATNQTYPQMHGPFIPGLSILDYAMNCGPDSFY